MIGETPQNIDKIAKRFTKLSVLDIFSINLINIDTNYINKEILNSFKVSKITFKREFVNKSPFWLLEESPQNIDKKAYFLPIHPFQTFLVSI